MPEHGRLGSLGPTHTEGFSPTKAPDYAPGAKFPAEPRSCLEAYFDMDAHEVNVWLDGVEADDLHRTD